MDQKEYIPQQIDIEFIVLRGWNSISPTIYGNATLQEVIGDVNCLVQRLFMRTVLYMRTFRPWYHLNHDTLISFSK